MSGDEIKRRRSEQGWSQAQLAREMRRIADHDLPSMDSLIRSIKRWESGEVDPVQYAELLERTFSQGFSLDRELLDRLERSDLGADQIAEIRTAIDGLAVSYTTNEPENLLEETWLWLDRLDRARSGRLTIGQLTELTELTGWTALLAGNLAHDLNNDETARRAQRLGLTAGQEAGADRLIAWGHELAAWLQMGAQNYQAVIERARAGQRHAGQTDIGAHLIRHEAESWAALGERDEALRALERSAVINDVIEAPEVPNHHFQKDKGHQEKVEMLVARSLDDHTTTIRLAEAIEHQFTGEDGDLLRPMRVAKARAAKATALAKEGELDEATAIGESVFDIERQGVPEVMRNTAELADLLAEFKPAEALLAQRAERQEAEGQLPDRLAHSKKDMQSDHPPT